MKSKIIAMSDEYSDKNSSNKPLGWTIGRYASLAAVAALTGDIILRHENSLVISGVTSLNNPFLELPVVLGVLVVIGVGPPVIGVYVERGARRLAEYSRPRIANIKERIFHPQEKQADSSSFNRTFLDNILNETYTLKSFK